MPRRSIKSASDVPAEPADLLPQILAKRPRGITRDRSWDAAHPKATYRLPAEVREQLKVIAHEEGVSADDLARLALERFIADYHAGCVELKKHPKVGTYTLYPK